MSEITKEELEKMSPEEMMELQKKNCIFCKMVTGEIPVYKIFEDSVCVAILDINPANEGHVLLLPKEHYQILTVVPPEIINHLMSVAKKISQMMLSIMKVKGTSLYFEIGDAAGQKAPHVLLHIIPADKDKPILKPQTQDLPDEKFNELLKKLRAKTGFNPNSNNSLDEKPKKQEKPQNNKEKKLENTKQEQSQNNKEEKSQNSKQEKPKTVNKPEEPKPNNKKEQVDLDKIDKLFN